MKLSTAKKIHPETGGWFLEAYSVMMNFRAKVKNSIAKVTNSFANKTNSIAKSCKILQYNTKYSNRTVISTVQIIND